MVGSVSENSPGFCYISLIRCVLGKSINLGYLVRKFGAFPKIRDVLLYICSKVNSDRYVYNVYFSNFSVLHVDKFNLVLLSDLLVKFLFSECVIGYDAGVDVSCMRAQKALELASLVKAAGKDTEYALREAANLMLTKEVRNDNSLVSAVLCGDFYNRIKPGRDVHISHVLTPVELAEIQANFPEFVIKFKGRKAHPHAAAAAVRILSMELVFEWMGYTKSSASLFGEDIFLIDIGGNWYTHVRQNRMNIHSCTPCIDYRDSARETERKLSLAKLVTEKKMTNGTYVALTSKDKSCKQRCFNLAQECSVTATYAVCMHSQYDISITEFAEILDVHDIKVCYSVVHFSPEILYKKEGFIRDIKCRFVRESDKIHFDFVGDSSMSYSHSYNNYLAMITTPGFITSSGRCYVAERLGDRCGCLFIKYTYCESKPINLDLFSRVCFWVDPDDRQVIVSGWEYQNGYYLDSKFFRVNDSDKRGRFVRKHVSLNARLWNLIFSNCMRATEKGYNLTEILSAASAYNSRMTINGVDIRSVSAERLNVEDLMFVVVCAYCVSYVERYNCGKVVEAFTKQEKIKRNKGHLSFFSVVEYVCSLFGSNCFKQAFNSFIDAVSSRKEDTDDLSFEFCLSTVCVTVEKFVSIIANHEPFRTDVCFNNDELNNSECDEVEFILDDGKIVPRLKKLEKIEKVEKKMDVNVTTREVKSVSRSRTVSKSLSNKTVKRLTNEFYRVSHGLSKGSSLSSDHISCINSLREELMSCDEELERFIVRGDGTCVYGVMRELLGLPDNFDVNIIKHIIYFCLDDVNKKIQNNLLTDELGTTDNMSSFCAMLNVRLCVHVVDDVGNTITTRNYSLITDENCDCVHVRWSTYGAGHADLLYAAGQRDRRVNYFSSFVNSFFKVLFEKKNHNVKYFYDPYAVVPIVGVVNRSGVKLLELLCDDEIRRVLLGTNLGRGYDVLDLCGAPGGFCHVLATRTECARILSFSHPDLEYVDCVRNLPKVDVWYGDLFDDNFVGGFKNSSFDLLLADGAKSDSYCNNEFLKREMNVITRKLKVGGSVLLKLHNFPSQMHLLRRFSQYFNYVRMVKPLSSLSGNTECYVVFGGYSSTIVESEIFGYDELIQNLVVGMRNYANCVDGKFVVTDFNGDSLMADLAVKLPIVSMSAGGCLFSKSKLEEEFEMKEFLIKDEESIDSCDTSKTEKTLLEVINDNDVVCGVRVRVNDDSSSCRTSVTSCKSVRECEASSPVDGRTTATSYLELPSGKVSSCNEVFEDVCDKVCLVSEEKDKTESDKTESDDSSVGEIDAPLVLPEYEEGVKEQRLNSYIGHVGGISRRVKGKSLFEKIFKKKQFSREKVYSMTTKTVTKVDGFSKDLDGSLNGVSIVKYNVIDNCSKYVNVVDKACGAGEVEWSVPRRIGIREKRMKNICDIGVGCDFDFEEEKIKKTVEDVDTTSVASISLSVSEKSSSTSVTGFIDDELPDLLSDNSSSLCIPESSAVSSVDVAEDFVNDNLREWCCGMERINLPSTEPMRVVSGYMDAGEMKLSCLLTYVWMRDGKVYYSRLLSKMCGKKVSDKKFLDKLRDKSKNIFRFKGCDIVACNMKEHYSKNRINVLVLCVQEGMSVTNCVSDLILEIESFKIKNFRIGMDVLNYQNISTDLVCLARSFVGLVCVRLVLFCMDYNMGSDNIFSSVYLFPNSVDRDVFPQLSDAELGFVRCPALLSDGSVESSFKNSMIEYLHVTRMADDIYRDKLTPIFKSLFKTNSSINAGVLSSLKNQGIFVYDNKLRQFIDKSISDFEWGFTVIGKIGAFVKFDKNKKFFDCENQYVFVTRQTKLMLNQDMVKTMSKVNIDDVRFPNISWVNGPPGCGKTEYAIKNHAVATKDFVGDMILSVTKEGCESVRERVKNLKGLDEKILKMNYRTVASLMVNGCSEKYDKVIVDEALMVHAGSMGFISAFTGCKNLVLIGDVSQIPYIDRDHVCPIRFGNPSVYCSVSEILCKSYRCPIDVCRVLSAFYEGIYTVNSVVRSLKRQYYSGNDIPKRKDNAYLVLFQSDKDNLLRNGYEKVLTVHEAQGLSFENVVYIRTSVKPLSLYDSLGHAIVAISRHTKTFVYYSDADDLITKWIDSVRLLSEKELCAWNNERKIMAGESMSAGFYVGPEFGFVNEQKPFISEKAAECVRVLPSADHCPNVPVIFREGVCSEVISPEYSKCAIDCDINYVQDWYCAAMQGVCDEEVTNDQMIVEESDVFINIAEKIRVVNDKAVYCKKSRFEKLRPVLKTLMPANRLQSQKETILAMSKRNLNVPNLMSGNVSAEHIAECLFKNFIKSCVKDEVNGGFDEIEVSAANLTKWLNLQSTSVRGAVASDLPLHERWFNRYSFMVKDKLKPPLEKGAEYKYPGGQTIAYQSKDVNAVFCPVMSVVRDRVLASLRDNIIINTAMSNEEFELLINQKFSAEKLWENDRVENDFSKYDKSQMLALLLLEIKIMKFFGVSEWLCDIWFECHSKSIISDRKNGVQIETEYQRKSGDASTFMGNTLVMIAVLASVYDFVNDLVLGLFAGDDSLLFLFKGKYKDVSKILADLFNLESKLLNDYKYSYFCSKFLIKIGMYAYVVPDLLKVITKLGRTDLVNYEHVEEYRVSLCDNLKTLNNELIHEDLNEALIERYHCLYDSAKVVRVLMTYVNDAVLFRSLYVVNDEKNLCFDKSRPKLD